MGDTKIKACKKLQPVPLNEVHPRTGQSQGEIGRGLFCVLPWPHQEGGFGILRARNTVGISVVLSGKRPGAVKACPPEGAGEGERPASARVVAGQHPGPAGLVDGGAVGSVFCGSLRISRQMATWPSTKISLTRTKCPFASCLHPRS